MPDIPSFNNGRGEKRGKREICSRELGKALPSPEEGSIPAQVILAAGLMTTAELAAALAWQQSQEPAHPPFSEPYILAGVPGSGPTSALRWRWHIDQALVFCAWATAALHRFDLAGQVVPDGALPTPERICIEVDEQYEVCDWRYLNENHWMGAFCTIANRLLQPRGVCALSFETGWIDTVVCLCWAEHAEAVLEIFPESE